MQGTAVRSLINILYYNVSFHVLCPTINSIMIVLDAEAWLGSRLTPGPMVTVRLVSWGSIYIFEITSVFISYICPCSQY